MGIRRRICSTRTNSISWMLRWGRKSRCLSVIHYIDGGSKRSLIRLIIIGHFIIPFLYCILLLLLNFLWVLIMTENATCVQIILLKFLFCLMKDNFKENPNKYYSDSKHIKSVNWRPQILRRCFWLCFNIVLISNIQHFLCH